jgi:hypothetical protein
MQVHLKLEMRDAGMLRQLVNFAASGLLKFFTLYLERV